MQSCPSENAQSYVGRGPNPRCDIFGASCRRLYQSSTCPPPMTSLALLCWTSSLNTMQKGYVITLSTSATADKYTFSSRS